MANSVIRSIVVMLIGLLMIFWNESVVGLIIRVVGVAFLLPALPSIVNLYFSRGQGERYVRLLISVIDVGSISFGLWLMISPASFEALFVKLLALLLLLFAVYQLAMVVMAQKRYIVSWWMYVVPLVMIVAAITLFLSSFRPLATLSVIFGFVALVSGVSDLIISLKLNRGRGSSDVVKMP